MRTDTLTVLVAQPEQNVVHYCRIAVGAVRWLDGQPFDVDHEQRQALAQQAWEIIKEWLNEQGLQIRHGVIDGTPGLKVEGATGFLEFDNGKQAYIRKSVQ